MLPWGEMLRAALVAGVAPEAFWRLSLREWRWMTTGASAFSRETLQQLMQDYPDKDGTGTLIDERY